MSLSFTTKTDNTYYRLSLYSILCTTYFFLLASAGPSVRAARVPQSPLFLNFPQIGVSAATRTTQHTDLVIPSGFRGAMKKGNQAEAISQKSLQKGEDVLDLKLRFHIFELDFPLVTRRKGTGFISSFPSLPFIGTTRGSIPNTSEMTSQRLSRATADLLRKRIRRGRGMIFAKVVSENIIPMPEYIQFEIQLLWLVLFLRMPSLTTDSEGRVHRRHFTFHKDKNKINKD